MAAHKGHKKSGGRTKGTPNKRTFDAQILAQRLGIDPLEILLNFSTGNWKALGYKSGKVTKYGATGIPYEEDLISPELRHSSAGKAAEYIYPKRKALEHTLDESTITNITRTILTKPVER